MKDFISSDYCTECGGEGFIVESRSALFCEKVQCESCEELSEKERLADIYQDIARGN